MSKRSMIASISVTIFISIMGVLLLLSVVLNSLLNCVTALLGGL